MKWKLLLEVAVLAIGIILKWSPWAIAACVLFIAIDPEARWTELLEALRTRRQPTV